MKKAGTLFKKIFKKPQKNQQHIKNDSAGSDDDLNIISPANQATSITDQILHSLSQSQTDLNSEAFLFDQQQDDSAYVDFVVVVGFHHSVGSQVEYVHPPLHEDKAEIMSTAFLTALPALALPDGSHIAESGYVYFLLRDKQRTFHCVSCFRQIEAQSLSNKDESVIRAYVQKAVVIMSQKPLYGEIRSKLQPTTEAYFCQKDFKDTQILRDLFLSANQFNQTGNFDHSQYIAALNFRHIFELPNLAVLSLLKALLLERRIVVYSKLASRVSQCVYSMLALIPGCVYLNRQANHPNKDYLEQWGWPFQLFAESQFLPMVCLPDIDSIDTSKGFLLGTTNQLLLDYPKLNADLLVDLDKSVIKCKHDVLTKHTAHERKLFQFKAVFQAKKLDLNGKLISSDVEDRSGLMQRDDSTENELYKRVANYLQDLCIELAYLKNMAAASEDECRDKGRSSEVTSGQVIIDTTEIDHRVKEVAQSQKLLAKNQESGSEDDENPFSGQCQKTEVDQREVHKLLKTLLSDKKFSRQFIIDFTTQTTVFKYWLTKHSSVIAGLHQNHDQSNILLLFENGDYYKGSLYRGLKHGQGIFHRTCDNSTYSGYWLNDKREGEGQLTIEGDEYVYDGSWHNHMREGVGMEICKMKGKYTGGWHQDKRHGQGVSVLPDGTIFSGHWHQGLKHGKGRLTTENGEIIEAEWQRDLIKKKVNV